MMREQLNEMADLNQVTGGRYHLNKSKKLLFFDNVSGVFEVKGSVYTAQELMDSLVGRYSTEAEYDNACVELLRSHGII